MLRVGASPPPAAVRDSWLISLHQSKLRLIIMEAAASVDTERIDSERCPPLGVEIRSEESP